MYHSHHYLLHKYESIVKKYPGSKHAKQAMIEIDDFPEYIINKSESLRKKDMVKEAIDHLGYMIENFTEHSLVPKAQYMLGDIYMKSF